MKKQPVSFVLILLMAFASGLLQQSCKKNQTPVEPVFLTVNLPKLSLRNELFYPLDYQKESIEMEFSEPIDSSTIKGNISFADKTGLLDTTYTLVAMDRKMLLLFKPGFTMKAGWRYLITIGTGLRSINGTSFSAPCILEFRTGSQNPNLNLGSGAMQRNAILCISDIHLGEYRAVTGKYCWFSENQAALVDLLDNVITGKQVREVVIMGDLFDGWIIPYGTSPFDSSAGISDSRGYFLSVASSPVNLPIIAKFRAIASSSDIRLIYVPGNHDMLLTRSVLEEIIPGIIWQGSIDGLGNYSPEDEIIMEHGHRFDFFNCPQPLVRSGSILPPGFFVSRLQAAGLQKQGGAVLKSGHVVKVPAEFLLAWTISLAYLSAQYSLTVNQDSVNILMGGIDGYHDPFSFNGARNMYAASIENRWSETQARNAVPVPMSVAMAILDGCLDMFVVSTYEYMSTTAPRKYKIAAFGHTHIPELMVFPSGKDHQGIYANTGSWVNAELTGKPVRTYLMIWPGKWSGSDLDVVSLYQYNLDSNSGNPNPDYIHTLLAEESITIHSLP